MFKKLSIAILGSALAVAAQAQDAEVGKKYEVTVAAEVDNPFVGSFGDARIGKIALQIPGAKAGEKYSVTIIAIKENGFTGLQQATCTYEQVGGDRKGQCNAPPG